AETGAGIDPLDDAFTPDALFALTRGRRTPIKALLMDQRRLAGLGNIYANEILFRAGVRPGRRAARLARDDCRRIVAAARMVLADAIRRGGSSISDYRDGLGREGARPEAAAALAREPEEAAHARVLADDGHPVGRERPESGPLPAERVRHERRGEPGEPLEAARHRHVVGLRVARLHRLLVHRAQLESAGLGRE